MQIVLAIAVLVFGALSLIGAGVLAIYVGNPFGLTLAVVAAGVTYVFQCYELRGFTRNEPSAYAFLAIVSVVLYVLSLMTSIWRLF